MSTETQGFVQSKQSSIWSQPLVFRLSVYARHIQGHFIRKALLSIVHNKVGCHRDFSRNQKLLYWMCCIQTGRVHSCCSENEEWLLIFLLDRRLFLAYKNFRPSQPTLSSSQWEAQDDRIASDYQCQECLQDCRLYWSTSLNFDHSAICIELPACFIWRFEKHDTALFSLR